MLSRELLDELLNELSRELSEELSDELRRELSSETRDELSVTLSTAKGLRSRRFFASLRMTVVRASGGALGSAFR